MVGYQNKGEEVVFVMDIVATQGMVGYQNTMTMMPGRRSIVATQGMVGYQNHKYLSYDSLQL